MFLSLLLVAFVGTAHSTHPQPCDATKTPPCPNVIDECTGRRWCLEPYRAECTGKQWIVAGTAADPEWCYQTCTSEACTSDYITLKPTGVTNNIALYCSFSDACKDSTVVCDATPPQSCSIQCNAMQGACNGVKLYKSAKDTKFTCTSGGTACPSPAVELPNCKTMILKLAYPGGGDFDYVKNIADTLQTCLRFATQNKNDPTLLTTHQTGNNPMMCQIKNSNAPGNVIPHGSPPGTLWSRTLAFWGGSCDYSTLSLKPLNYTGPTNNPTYSFRIRFLVGITVPGTASMGTVDLDRFRDLICKMQYIWDPTNGFSGVSLFCYYTTSPTSEFLPHTYPNSPIKFEPETATCLPAASSVPTAFTTCTGSRIPTFEPLTQRIFRDTMSGGYFTESLKCAANVTTYICHLGDLDLDTLVDLNTTSTTPYYVEPGQYKVTWEYILNGIVGFVVEGCSDGASVVHEHTDRPFTVQTCATKIVTQFLPESLADPNTTDGPTIYITTTPPSSTTTTTTTTTPGPTTPTPSILAGVDLFQTVVAHTNKDVHYTGLYPPYDSANKAVIDHVWINNNSYNQTFWTAQGTYMDPDLRFTTSMLLTTNAIWFERFEGEWAIVYGTPRAISYEADPEMENSACIDTGTDIISPCIDTCINSGHQYARTDVEFPAVNNVTDALQCDVHVHTQSCTNSDPSCVVPDAPVPVYTLHMISNPFTGSKTTLGAFVFVLAISGMLVIAILFKWVPINRIFRRKGETRQSPTSKADFPARRPRKRMGKSVIRKSYLSEPVDTIL